MKAAGPVRKGADGKVLRATGVTRRWPTLHTGWRWYITELAEVTVFGSVPAVERDLYWEPQTLGEIRRQSR